MVLLTTEVESKNIRSNKSGQAIGTIIESHVDKGEGPVATILIQNGTLSIGDQLCFNDIIFGKARALKNYRGENIKSAGPSTPAKIIGLKVAPKVGDIMEVGDGARIKFKKNQVSEKQSRKKSKDTSDDDKIVKFNIILKTDMLGSGEAIEESLEKLSSKKAKINVIYRGLGNITEGDVVKAESSNALLVAFHVKVPSTIQGLAREKKVKIESYDIIYKLIEDIEKGLKNIIEPEFERVQIGKLKVLAIFRTEHASQIIGGKVLEGGVETDVDIEVMRNKESLCYGKLTNLQSGKQDVKRVEADTECGLSYEGKPLVEVGDMLVFSRNQRIKEEN